MSKMTITLAGGKTLECTLAEVAAIPDMLAALRGIAKLYGCVWDRTDGCLVVMPDNIERFDAAFGAISAAIRKAEGA